MENVRFAVAFEKANATGRYVRGWASVAEMDGKSVVDWEGDVIAMDTLRKAFHEFVSNARVAKAMHKGKQVGHVIECVIVDDEFAKAMGATTTKRGAWIGMEITDPAVRARVRKGEFKGFSIGGRGARKSIEAPK